MLRLRRWRKRRRHGWIWWDPVIALFIAAASIGLALDEARESTARSGLSTAARQAALPEAGAPPSSQESKVQERVQLVSPPPPGPPREIRLSPPFDIIDARTFVSGDWAVTLPDIEGPEREAVCVNAQGRFFACGLAARAALNNALRRNGAVCRTRAAVNAERVLADCGVEGGDLALALVRQGWARPVSGAPPELEEARRAAEAQSAGMWNGGWRIR